MALYQSTGNISAMTEVQCGISNSGFHWQNMTIVLDIPGYQGTITKQAFRVSGDDVEEVMKYNVGDKVEVSWAMYAREWNNKWFNSVELVRIGVPQEQASVSAKRKAATKEDELNPDMYDDLPFDK